MINQEREQTNKLRQVRQADQRVTLRRQKNKHYVVPIKKEKHICVILGTCNNNSRIRSAILIAINSCYTATDVLKTIFKLHAAVLN